MNTNEIRFSNATDSFPGIEPFIFLREGGSYIGFPDGGKLINFRFCTTGRDVPADIVVMLVLLVLEDQFGPKMKVSSDGGQEEWDPAFIEAASLVGVNADITWIKCLG